ncbi:LacI family DNA-binding transcriptional regulator [Sinorhizobium medicae]|uniref:LacI family DNA-binding transcriptional regulator n=1 Tax=Sinorhizobium medicae TaxID=110321 RepID=UPI00036354D8|nr:LacI family DNA-binding transcriptional regulator [Sinorhizobium medicae]MDX0625038.1 LacI family DNA-binding transcriptional regulator [Sinorhizobium medicae]MDX0877344.1 LacI family DNA-binding transcriptional regulator [Sinorhizobium medicae]MDX0994303.1 LacI family DNA-binding transcriptional regulator [Sinorhizobium medicae]MDX1122880.1 LacI family DNA-binding transcriptional regulator [Sinorhizobium medicae]MDX1178163.1 LacI family DNA-binding transcriptional regulator [Sinorhizobium 
MVTIKEIASAVGVSSATVSRVLNYDPTLSISTRKRQAIIETAEALNYATPRNRNRAAAQAVGSGLKIALVHFLDPAQELADPYYVGVRLGIESRCQALNSEVVKVFLTGNTPEATILEGASGVVAVGHYYGDELEWLRRHSRHLVFADYAPAGDIEDTVLSDVSQAMIRLLEAVHAMGYRRIGFIGWIDAFYGPDNIHSERRCRTYIDWMTKAGLFDPELCLVDPMTPDSGYRLAKAMLSKPNPPKILITCNDNMALGAYRAINEMGLRIPDDVAVASFNDIPVAQFLGPPLSTVKIPAELIGETAVDLLVERLSGREVAKKVVFGTEIIWRASTPAPTGAANPAEHLVPTSSASEVPG